jgi:hypothetical protein
LWLYQGNSSSKNIICLRWWKENFDTTNLYKSAMRGKGDKVADRTEHWLLSAENRKLFPRLDKCLIVVGTIGEISKISVKLKIDFENWVEH